MYSTVVFAPNLNLVVVVAGAQRVLNDKYTVLVPGTWEQGKILGRPIYGVSRCLRNAQYVR